MLIYALIPSSLNHAVGKVRTVQYDNGPCFLQGTIVVFSISLDQVSARQFSLATISSPCTTMVLLINVPTKLASCLGEAQDSGRSQEKRNVAQQQVRQIMS